MWKDDGVICIYQVVVNFERKAIAQGNKKYKLSARVLEHLLHKVPTQQI